MTDVNFEWITDRGTTPYVTIDAHNRLYIPKPTRDLLGLSAGRFELILGYDFANRRIALGLPDISQSETLRPYRFDKRSYSNAKYFVERTQLGKYLPTRFRYLGNDIPGYPEGAYVFEMPDRG